MQLQTPLLLTFLILVLPSLSSPVSQNAIQLTCSSTFGVEDPVTAEAVTYGYQGPGVYRISSLDYYKNIHLNDTSVINGSAVAVW